MQGQAVNALDDRIQELITYARERSDEDRSVLYRNLIDLFLTGKAPNKQPTRNQLLDVIEALIPYADEDTRQTVVDLLLKMASPPMDLIMRLVKDSALVVSNLLRHAPFSEDDCIQIIEITGRAHHQELATREDLSANVWIALARAAPAVEDIKNSVKDLWNGELGAAKKSATVTQIRPAAGGEVPLFIDDEIDDAVSLSPEMVNAAFDINSFAQRRNQEIGTGEKTGERTGEIAGEKAGEKAGEQHEKQADTARNTAPEIRILDEERSPIFDDEYLTTGNKQAPEAFADKPLKPAAAVSPSQEDKAAPVLEESNDEHVEGQWSWSCDRFFNIDKKCIDKSNPLSACIDTASPDIFTLLGLEEKPNHPVSRALKRRGAIHDAPIYLASMSRGKRYWTLDATPDFSADGMFEGYVGRLQPVLPHDENSPLAMPEKITPLYEGNETASPATNLGEHAPVDVQNSPESQPLVPDTETMISGAIESLLRSNVEAATEQAIKGMRNQLEDAIEQQEDAEQEDSKKMSKAPDVATVQTQHEAQTSSAKLTSPTPAAQSSAITEALATLENTFAQIQSAASKGDQAKLSFHMDIAAACIRAIKSTLSQTS